MKTDSSRLDEISPGEGAQFLKNLDAALKGRAADGEDKALAEFGASSARQLCGDIPAAASEALRVRVDRALNAPPTGVARVGRAMQRWRIGVLDVAALLAIGVLSISLYRAQSKNAPKPDADISNKAVADGEDKQKAEATVPDDYANDPEEPWAKKLREKLKEKVQLDFTDVSFENAIAALNAKINVDIVIDPKVRANGAHLTPVTLKTTGMSAEEVLNWTCRLADLSYVLQNQVVYIQPRSELVMQMETEVYDLSKTGMPADFLVLLIHEKAFPAEFADPATSIAEFKGKLLVTQRKSVHRKILSLLAVLAEKSSQSEITPVAPIAAPPWMKELESALEKPISLNSHDRDLTATLADFRAQTGLTVIVDPKVTNDIPPLNLKVSDMPAKLALAWIMRLSDLEYMVKDHAIFVHALNAYPGRDCVLTIYNISDLTGEDENDVAAIEEMVRSRVAPETWDAALGTCCEGKHGRLVVLQRPEVHAKIHAFLAKLRSSGIRADAPKPAAGHE